jgi:hypothetical protein
MQAAASAKRTRRSEARACADQRRSSSESRSDPGTIVVALDVEGHRHKVTIGNLAGILELITPIATEAEIEGLKRPLAP